MISITRMDKDITSEVEPNTDKVILLPHSSSDGVINSFETMSCLSSASKYTHSQASLEQRQKNAKRNKFNTWLRNMNQELDLHESRLEKIIQRLKEYFTYEELVELWDIGLVGEEEYKATRQQHSDLTKEVEELEALVQAKNEEISKLRSRYAELLCSISLKKSCLSALRKEYADLKTKKKQLGGAKLLLRGVQEGIRNW